jgi:hypothetical protein
VSPTGSDLPEHEQRAWDAIVADLSGQIDLGPEFPADRPAPAPAVAPVPDPPSAPADAEVEEDEDDSYVPPHPPPIPRPADAIGRFSWAAVIAGPLLVLITTLFEWDRWIANLGVILSIGGFVSLIWRMNDRDQDDDGAVI